MEMGYAQKSICTELKTLWAAPDTRFSLLVAMFLLSQIFLDNFYLMSDERLFVAGITLPTLIRYGLLLALFVLFLMRYRSKRVFVVLSAGTVLFLTYTAAHLAARNSLFVPAIIDHYRVFGEVSYLVSLAAPLVLLGIVFFSKMTFDQLSIVMCLGAIAASALIVVSNLTMTGLSTYGNVPIEGSFFQWFTDSGLDFSHLSTKGFFYFGNQISALMCFFVPFVLYVSLYLSKPLGATGTALSALAMVMLGTRASYYGIIALLVLGLLFVAVEALRSKTLSIGIVAVFACSLVGVLALYPVCPATKRGEVTSSIAQSKKPVQAKKKPKATLHPDYRIKPTKEQIEEFQKGHVPRLRLPKQEMISYLEKRLPGLRFNPVFYKRSYPYQLDPEFWFFASRLPITYRLDNRFMEKAMINRIIVKGNPRPEVAWLGIGSTRLEGIFNIEQDLVKQNISLGHIGLILFFVPYVLPLLVIAVNLSKSKKPYVSWVRFGVLFFSVSVLFGAAYKSGNALDSLLTLFFLAAAVGVSFRDIGSSCPEKGLTV